MKLDSKRNVLLFALSVLLLVALVLSWPRIGPSADADELHALTVQGMMGMGHRYPFQSWVVKGGSVL